MKNEEFETSFTIEYNGLLPDLTITAPKFIDYLQESAIRHADWAGYPMTWFAKEKKGWIITNWDINIIEYPIWGQKIIVSTYPIKFKGIVVYRGFEIFNTENKKMLEAVSQWVFTDLKLRKPIKAPLEMCENYGIIKKEPFAIDFSFPETKGFKTINKVKFAVRRRDIDTNYHANNISYITWVIDYIPENIYYNKKIKKIKINYKKEVKLGNNLELIIKQKNNNFFSEILNNDYNILAQIYIEFN